MFQVLITYVHGRDINCPLSIGTLKHGSRTCHMSSTMLEHNLHSSKLLRVCSGGHYILCMQSFFGGLKNAMSSRSYMLLTNWL